MILQSYFSKTTLIVLLISFILSLNLKGQELTDRIFTKDGDTINCKITLVNDQNIFYQYKKRRSIKADVISLNDVDDFYPKSKVLSNEKTISEPIVYYGIDFSKFKINDFKRRNQNIQAFIYIWLENVNEFLILENHLSELLKADQVFCDQIYTLSKIDSLNSHNMVSSVDSKLDKDCIADIIDNIIINENYEIGFIIVMENFSEPNKSISGYFIYFENKTKEILQINNFEQSGLIYSFNRVSHWGDAMRQVIVSNLEKMKIEF